MKRKKSVSWKKWPRDPNSFMTPQYDPSATIGAAMGSAATVLVWPRTAPGLEDSVGAVGASGTWLGRRASGWHVGGAHPWVQ